MTAFIAASRLHQFGLSIQTRRAAPGRGPSQEAASLRNWNLRGRSLQAHVLAENGRVERVHDGGVGLSLAAVYGVRLAVGGVDGVVGEAAPEPVPPGPAVEVVHVVAAPQLAVARAAGYSVHAAAGLDQSVDAPASTRSLPLRALMTSRTPEPAITSSLEELRQVPPPRLNAAARGAPAVSATDSAAADEIIAIRLINLPSFDALVYRRSRALDRSPKTCCPRTRLSDDQDARTKPEGGW